MKILVTGKNGFVAKNLCQKLREENLVVVTTTRNKDDDKHNFQLGDLNVETDWSQALKEVDIVVHLAARVHVMQETSKDPYKEFMKSNFEATKKLAEEAYKQGVKKFIFMSSIFVNGLSTNSHPFSENDFPNPQNDYALSKLQAEEYLMKTYANSQMSVVIIRPPMIYGRDAKGNWESLIKICNLRLPLPFKSFNKNKRNFIYVENLNSFILSVINKEPKTGIYTISDNEAISTYEFVKQICKNLKNKSYLFSIPFLEKILSIIGKKEIYDKLASNLVINNSKAKKDFDWNPPYTVYEGIKKSIN